MSRLRINQQTLERCLLTEVVPYETPLLFSNWGAYNYCRELVHKTPPSLVKALFTDQSLSIPYKYGIKKDLTSHRTLFLIHPKHSAGIVSLYTKFSIMILRACRRSSFSLRAPHHIAKFFVRGSGRENVKGLVEDITAETAYTASYFAYSRFSHLHKFFDSDEFTELEKRYAKMVHLDISKFFPSLYTHSISWAIRGKSRAKKAVRSKRKTFDSVFDHLLQNVNHNETHGIPIGPELCRIFAEVILQKVDDCVVKSLESKGILIGEHYRCRRYIDDYFVFFNEDHRRDTFLKILRQELEVFRLYLNEAKIRETPRPFITDVSVRKLQISTFVRDLMLRKSELRASKSQQEINRLRALCRDEKVPFSSVSSLLLNTLERHIVRINAGAESNFFDVTYVLLDLAFHALRMDLRVATSIRIANIVLNFLKKSKFLKAPERAQIMDKIVFEMRGAIESAMLEGSALECMNLLIACAEFAEIFAIPPDLLTRLIDCFAAEHKDEYSNGKRLGYFEIVSLIYYIGDSSVYVQQRARLLLEAERVLKSFNPVEYAESAYLFFDLVSCPYLKDSEKDQLVSIVSTHCSPNLPTKEVTNVRNYVSKRSWFFNWNENRTLKAHLKKKQLLIAY